MSMNVLSLKYKTLRRIQYSQKYWRSLNSALWPHTNREQILAEFKFGGGGSGPLTKERCHLLLEVLKQSHEFTNLQQTKRTLAPSQLHVQQCRGVPVGAKNTMYCMHNVIMHCIRNDIGRFQFGSFNPDHQTVSIHQIFWLCSMLISPQRENEYLTATMQVHSVCALFRVMQRPHANQHLHVLNNK